MAVIELAAELTRRLNDHVKAGEWGQAAAMADALKGYTAANHLRIAPQYHTETEYNAMAQALRLAASAIPKAAAEQRAINAAMQRHGQELEARLTRELGANYPGMQGVARQLAAGAVAPLLEQARIGAALEAERAKHHAALATAVKNGDNPGVHAAITALQRTHIPGSQQFIDLEALRPPIPPQPKTWVGRRVAAWKKGRAARAAARSAPPGPRAVR